MLSLQHLVLHVQLLSYMEALVVIPGVHLKVLFPIVFRMCSCGLHLINLALNSDPNKFCKVVQGPYLSIFVKLSLSLSIFGSGSFTAEATVSNFIPDVNLK